MTEPFRTVGCDYGGTLTLSSVPCHRKSWFPICLASLEHLPAAEQPAHHGAASSFCNSAGGAGWRLGRACLADTQPVRVLLLGLHVHTIVVNDEDWQLRHDAVSHAQRGSTLYERTVSDDWTTPDFVSLIICSPILPHHSRTLLSFALAGRHTTGTARR